MATHYAVLGISHRAPLAEIERAHRRLAAQFHPDLHAGDRAAGEKFKAIQLAYDILSDETRRRAYDEHLQRQLELKADRWLARTIRGWRTSARRHHRHRAWHGWRPAHWAAAAVAACVLVGSVIALLHSPGTTVHYSESPLDPSLVAVDHGPSAGGMADQPADSTAARPLPVVPASVEVSSPSSRDFYRPPSVP